MGTRLKKGIPVNSQSREIVYNVYKYFLNEAETFKKSDNCKYFNKLQERVIEATGISKCTLGRILKEADQKPPSMPFETPQRKRPKKDFLLNLDSFDYDVIRRMVYDFHSKFKELPNLKKLRLKLIEAINFKGSTFTLRKILRKLGFRYCKTKDNRKTLMEKHDVRLKRTKYLDKIKKNRIEGREIVYMDESYIHTSHVNGKGWSDSSNAGIKKPISKGQRLIIAHAGSENGFIPGALLTYKSTDTTGDYHKEMNSENYEKWLRNQLIPNLPTNSVLVVDNAPYHNKYIEKLPNSNTRKQDMIDWLKNHNIPVNPNQNKPAIYDIILQNKQEHIQYSIDKIMAEYGHSVLRLPPYHPDFNPIENIWAQIKQYVAQRNVDMNMTSIKNLLKEKVNMIGPEDWKKVCQHAIKCEEDFRIYENKIDDYSDQFIINTNDSDAE